VGADRALAIDLAVSAVRPDARRCSMSAEAGHDLDPARLSLAGGRRRQTVTAALRRSKGRRGPTSVGRVMSRLMASTYFLYYAFSDQ
jgi:hypothetical protein